MAKYVVAHRTFTYDVEEVRQSIKDINNDQDLNVTDTEVYDLINEWVYEDMRSPASRHDLRLTDEDGNELNY